MMRSPVAGHPGDSLQHTCEAPSTRRHAQFTYINAQATAHLTARQPVVGVGRKRVDKEKELGGPYVNLGAEWQPAWKPWRSRCTTSPTSAWARRSPTGHDLGRNHGWVSVGATDHDTAAFAVATLRRWWLQVGKAAYRRGRGCWRTR